MRGLLIGFLRLQLRRVRELTDTAQSDRGGVALL